jgi:hypothetical protein
MGMEPNIIDSVKRIQGWMTLAVQPSQPSMCLERNLSVGMESTEETNVRMQSRKGINGAF